MSFWGKKTEPSDRRSWYKRTNPNPSQNPNPQKKPKPNHEAAAPCTTKGKYVWKETSYYRFPEPEQARRELYVVKHGLPCQLAVSGGPWKESFVSIQFFPLPGWLDVSTEAAFRGCKGKEFHTTLCTGKHMMENNKVHHFDDIKKRYEGKVVTVLASDFSTRHTANISPTDPLHNDNDIWELRWVGSHWKGDRLSI